MLFTGLFLEELSRYRIWFLMFFSFWRILVLLIINWFLAFFRLGRFLVIIWFSSWFFRLLLRVEDIMFVIFSGFWRVSFEFVYLFICVFGILRV